MTTIKTELALELKGETDIVFTRHFDAPVDMVYDCHTKPELMRQWLTGPDGWEFDICEVDLRVGGKYLSSWHQNGQNKFGFHGSYREIVAPERVVNTEIFIPDMATFDRNAPEDLSVASVNTLVLSADQNMTLMHLVCRYPSAEVRKAVLETGMAEGMEASYKRLDSIFLR